MRWKNILFNTSFAITCLLGFLLIFEGNLRLPLWLQVFGRTHPLVLHVPIGLLLLYCIIELFSSSGKIQSIATEIKDGLMLVTALTISLTALMGLFLSKEEGYDAEVISLHKWAGAAISFILLAWCQWRNSIRKKPVLNKSIALLSILLIIVTGHEGGNITHGENYLLAQLMEKKTSPADIPLDDAVVFNHMVQPILESKCISCHNERKAKGELLMETPALLKKGGKNGKLWDTTANDLGLMLQRMHLPLEHEQHMPPKGKPQLTEGEKAILEQWIRTGSDFTIKVTELKKGDTLMEIASTVFSNQDKEAYNFENADEGTVKSLNNFYRVVQPIAEESPALTVRFFGPSKFKTESIKELSPVYEQVVRMDLSRMPIDDKHLTDIASFRNLRTLNLNFTGIKGVGFVTLKNLKRLKEISLSGTLVDGSVLDQLLQFPALKKVYLWNTAVSKAQIAALPKTNKKISFETGDFVDTVMLQLTPPIIQNRQFVISEPVNLKLKHNINGAQIRYTQDGSKPDSINSQLYKGDVLIDMDLLIKTRVFRNGWMPSEVQTARFYISKLKPEKIHLLNLPDKNFKGDGESTLMDQLLAGVDLTTGRWLGYQKPGLDVLLDFGKKVRMSTVTISFITNHDLHAFPPASINLWYGNDSNHLEKLPTITPRVPVEKQPNENIPFSFKMPVEEFQYVRIEAKSIGRLPSWVDKKLPPGWIFIDEIIIK